MVNVPNFFSPERLLAWERRKDIPLNEIFKADAFSLGIVMLQTGNLQKLMLGANQNQAKLKDEISKFGKRYSKDLTDVLKQMLVWDVDDRLDLTQALDLMLEKKMFGSRYKFFIQEREMLDFRAPKSQLDKKQINYIQKIKALEKELERV